MSAPLREQLTKHCSLHDKKMRFNFLFMGKRSCYRMEPLLILLVTPVLCSRFILTLENVLNFSSRIQLRRLDYLKALMNLQRV